MPLARRRTLGLGSGAMNDCRNSRIFREQGRCCWVWQTWGDFRHYVVWDRIAYLWAARKLGRVEVACR